MFNARIASLERMTHALLSARITLTWTSVLPVNRDLRATFLPLSSFGCSLVDVTVDSTGVAPIVTTRFKLDNPLPFNRRAQLLGSNLVAQGDLVPPNPIVGVIIFPAAVEQADDSMAHISNVVNNLLTPGTRSIWDLHVCIMTSPFK